MFIKIWEARNKIDVHTSFESFLFTIAYNSTISLLRKRANEQKYLEHLKSIQQIQKVPDFNEADMTHFSKKGAEAITGLIIKEIKTAVPELSEYIK